MWKLSHFYLKKVSTVSPVNAESVGGLGFSTNGVKYHLSNVMSGHSLSLDFSPRILQRQGLGCRKVVWNVIPRKVKMRKRGREREYERQYERESKKGSINKVSAVGNESLILPGPLRIV